MKQMTVDAMARVQAWTRKWNLTQIGAPAWQELCEEIAEIEEEAVNRGLAYGERTQRPRVEADADSAAGGSHEGRTHTS